MGAELSELIIALETWSYVASSKQEIMLWYVLHCFKRALGSCNNFWICLVSSLVCKEIAF